MDTKNAIVHMKLGRRMKDQLGRVWEFAMLAGIAYYQYYEHRAGSLNGKFPFPAEMLERKDDNSLAPFTFAEPTFDREVADKYIDAGFVVKNTSNGNQYRREKGVFQVLDGGRFRDYLGSLNSMTKLHDPYIRFELVQSVVTTSEPVNQTFTGRTVCAPNPLHTILSPFVLGEYHAGQHVYLGVDYASIEKKIEAKAEEKNELTDFEALKLLMEGNNVYAASGKEWKPGDLVVSYEEADEYDDESEEVFIYNVAFFLSGPFTRNAPKKVEPKKTYTAEEAIVLVLRDEERVVDVDGDHWLSCAHTLKCLGNEHCTAVEFFNCGPFTIAD